VQVGLSVTEPDDQWIARMRARGLVCEPLLRIYPSLVRYAKENATHHKWWSTVWRHSALKGEA